MAKQNELAQPTLIDQSVDEVKEFKSKLKFMFENVKLVLEKAEEPEI